MTIVVKILVKCRLFPKKYTVHCKLDAVVARFGIKLWYITMTLWWVWWRIKSTAWRFSIQPFVQVKMIKNINVSLVTRKMFPFNDVIMYADLCDWLLHQLFSWGFLYQQRLAKPASTSGHGWNWTKVKQWNIISHPCVNIKVEGKGAYLHLT